MKQWHQISTTSNAKLKRAVPFMLIGLTQSSNAILMLFFSPVLLHQLGENGFAGFLLVFSMIGFGTIIGTPLRQFFPKIRDDLQATKSALMQSALAAIFLMSLLFVTVLFAIMSYKSNFLALTGWLHIEHYELLGICIIVFFELIDLSIGLIFKYQRRFAFDSISDLLGRAGGFVCLLALSGMAVDFTTIVICFLGATTVRVVLRLSALIKQMRLGQPARIDQVANITKTVIKLLPLGIISFSTGTLDRVVVSLTEKSSSVVISYVIGSQLGAISLLLSASYLTSRYALSRDSLILSRSVIYVLAMITFSTCVLGVVWSSITYPHSYFREITLTICLISFSNFMLTLYGYLSVVEVDRAGGEFLLWARTALALCSMPSMILASTSFGVDGVLIAKLVFTSLFLATALLRRQLKTNGCDGGKR